MNLQDVANLTIPEGEVKTIHDKNKKLLWGRLSYDTTYRGNTFQQTYTGRNLFNPALLSQVEGYNTYNSTTGLWTTNDGGSYHRSIFYSAAGQNSDRDVSKIVGPLAANTTYTVKFYDFVNNTVNTSRPLSYALFHSDNTLIADSGVRVDSFFTFTTPAETCYLDIRRLESTGTFSFSKIMITNGEYTEETFPSYEPYVGCTASPNPSFPQNVNVVTGEQTVTVTGKNLCSECKTTLNGSLVWFKLPVLNSNTITLSCTLNAALTGSSYALSIDDTIYTLGSWTQPANTRMAKAITFTDEQIAEINNSSDAWIRIFKSGAGFVVPNDYMIEYGSTATTYEPYQSQSYTVDLGSIELCKIGTYQDYIYKSGDDWYVHKEVEKVVLDGSESWENWGAVSQTITMAKRVLNFPTGIINLSNTESPVGKLEDTHFQLYAQNVMFNSDIEGIATNTGNLYVRINKTRLESADSDGLKTWFSSHNTTVYYALATPTDTEITDTTLVAQLNNIHQFLTRYGYNFSVSGDLPIIINQGGLT